jgi:hypothetical protein
MRGEGNQTTRVEEKGERRGEEKRGQMGKTK